MLTYSHSSDALFRGSDRLDPWSLSWSPAEALPDDRRAIEPLDALAWLYWRAKARRLAVAVIGPRQASLRQIATAEALGRRLGELGIPMITGGRSGVMEAASRGNLAAGGQPIGILPGNEWDEANPYVILPLPSGLGPARNAVIARVAVALIAVGGGHGTLSEMAFGLQFGRLVLALEDAPEIPGRATDGGCEHGTGPGRREGVQSFRTAWTPRCLASGRLGWRAPTAA